MKNHRSFLSVYDLTKEEIYYLMDRSSSLKSDKSANRTVMPLGGKKIGLIFEKSSTRTRVSFEAGILDLGGYPIFMSSRDLQLGRGEPVKDTARVLSRYIDGVVIRTFEQGRLDEFHRYFEKPVINGLTDLYHPAQILADIFTVYEIKAGILKESGGKNIEKNIIPDVLKNLKIVYFGDVNNMANSWISLQAMLDFELILAIPEGFSVDERVLNESKKHGGKFKIVNDKIEASAGADVVTTDVFISMGQEENKENNEKIEKLRPFIIDDSVIKSAKSGVIFLHCLPVHRNEEVAESVFEKFSNTVFQEAENRLHVQKAIMEMIF